jgi:lysophospholipase L1-like esterase
MRLIFLGDSLTWGGYGGDFVAEVARRLPQHTIINAGEGGNTVLNLLRRLPAVLEQRPDGVFVMVGGNDAISYSQPETRRYYARAQDIPDGVVTPDQFAAAYRDLLMRLQLAHTLAWVGLPPLEYSPPLAEAMRVYNAHARDAAEALNIPVLDLAAAFPADNLRERPALDQDSINLIGTRVRAGWDDYESERKAGGFTYTFDGLHFTPEAAARCGALVADFVQRDSTEG